MKFNEKNKPNIQTQETHTKQRVFTNSSLRKSSVGCFITLVILLCGLLLTMHPTIFAQDPAQEPDPANEEPADGANEQGAAATNEAWLTRKTQKLMNSGILFYDPEDLIIGAFYNGTGELGCSTLAPLKISGNTPEEKEQNKELLIAAMDEFIFKNTSSARRENSPFRGLGRQLVEGSLRAGVNPFFVLAVAMKETEFGTTGYYNDPERYDPIASNAFGRTATLSQPHVVGTGSGSGDGNTRTVRWYRYPSWANLWMEGE
jgi:hypothetical protein